MVPPGERADWTPPGRGLCRRVCIDDQKKSLKKALDVADLEAIDAVKAFRLCSKSFKRSKQKRLTLLESGKLNLRLRNFVDAKIVELEREQKAAKVKMRAAWAQYDARREDLDEFEQFLLDDGTHDAAGFQVLSAAEVEGTYPYYWRAELGLEGVQLFA
jgi:hypothetical protein